MGLSLTYLSLVVLFNSFFLSNFLLIRALRRYMDATTHLRPNDERTYQTLKQKVEAMLTNKALLIILGPYAWAYLYVQKKLEQYEEQGGGNGFQKGDVGMAFLFGFIRKPVFQSRRFPNWDPLPYKIGAVTTSTLVVLFVIFFSEPVLNKTLGLDSEYTSPTGGLCMADDMQDNVDNIIDRFVERSNISQAINQMKTVNSYLEALQEDTNLWGEKGYYCSDDKPIQTKSDFLASDRFGKKGGLHFFPGVCEESQHLALEAARSQTCMKEFCAVGEVVDIDSIGVAGVEELKDALKDADNAAGKLKAQCGKCNTGGMFEAGFGSLFGSSKMSVDDLDISVQGKGAVQGAINDANNAANNIKAEYEMTEETFCAVHEVPCPDFSKYDELSEIVEDVTLTKLEKIANVTAPAVSIARAEISESYYELLKLLLKQMEIASYVYALYTCLSLFFPSPQIVFKVNILHGIRNILFGVRKYTFVVSVIAVWWGIQYVRSFTWFAQFEIYMKVLLQDPCVAQKNYTESIGRNYMAICNTMFETHTQWRNANVTIQNIIDLVDPMERCCRDYPNYFLADFTNGFDYDSYPGHLVCDSGDCMFPGVNDTFLGNMAVCNDNNFVRREILELNEASTISWWDVWIKSGILASILLSPAVANFGISLAKLADPLMTCDGKYEGPPKGYNYEISELDALRERIIYSFKISATGRMMFWGLMVNVIVLNIVLGKQRVDEGPNSGVSDAVIAVIILFLAIGAFLVASKADQLLSRKVLLIEEMHNGDENGDGNEDDESKAYEVVDTSGGTVRNQTEESYDAEACESHVESESHSLELELHETDSGDKTVEIQSSN